MSENFTVEIISPDKSIIKTETNEVIIPSFEGEMGILKDHIPFITFLRPGIVKLSDKNMERFFIEEGTVEFSNNNLLILTSSAKDLANFDKSLVNELFQEAEEKLNNLDITDKDRYLTSYKLETLKEISQ